MVAKNNSNNKETQGKIRTNYGRKAKERSSDKVHKSKSQIPEEEDTFLSSLCYGDNEEESQQGKKPNIWLLFLYLLLSPKLGWRRIKKANFRIDDFARGLFYPLLALVAACRFVDLIYFDDISISTLLKQAVNLFIAGFGGYYLVSLLAVVFLPVAARVKLSTNFGKVYIMTVMSALAVCMILAELLPWFGMLLLVPPIYSAYILVKGIRYLRIPDTETTPVAAFMIFFCIGMPVAIYFMFETLMPSA